MSDLVGNHQAVAVPKPDGNYLIKSPTKGTPGVEFDVKIIEGRCKDRVLTFTGWFGGSNTERIAQSCEYAGAKVNRSTGEFDWSGMGSKTFSITVNLENGTPRVQWINQGWAPLPAAEKAALGAQIAAAFAAAGDIGSKVDPNDNVPF